MRRENVDLGRQLMDALSRRDLPSVVAMSDPDVEWHSFFAEVGSGGVYRGHEGARQWMSDLDEAWQIVDAEVDDGLAIADLAVLVGRIHYRGKGSGVESHADAGWVLRFRAGKVIRFRAFRDPVEALESVGLST